MAVAKPLRNDCSRQKSFNEKYIAISLASSANFPIFILAAKILITQMRHKSASLALGKFSLDFNEKKKEKKTKRRIDAFLAAVNAAALFGVIWTTRFVCSCARNCESLLQGRMPDTLSNFLC